MASEPSDDEHPLAQALLGRHLAIAAKTVFIIEWLAEADEKTGTLLARFLTKNGIPCELVPCQSKVDVLRALDRIAADAGKTMPVIHFESHGSQVGLVGPSPNGDELLLWEEMNPALTRANLGSRFNLILVGASCYGEGLMLSVGSEPSPLPFVAVVGYREEVNYRSLREALVAFYRSLLIFKVPLIDAVDAANREHFYEHDSEFRETSAARLALEAFVRELQEQDLADPRIRKAAALGLVELWRIAFAMDYIPENEDRFRIDIEEVLRVAASGIKVDVG